MVTEPLVHDETVMLDGLRFHFRDWGAPTAPAVVLLHAYLQHARTWDAVARGLADRFRVLALDLRGHGESDHAADYHELRLVGDVAAFADALGLGRFSLVGFSIGGKTAIPYALLYPDRVERLVLLECFSEGDEVGEEAWLADMRTHMTAYLSLPAAVAGPEEAAAAFRPLAPYATEEDLMHWVRGGLRQESDRRWTLRYDAVFRLPGPPGRLAAPMDVLRRRLAGLTCPTLMVAGAESWMVEPTKRMVTLTPRAQMVTVPQAGHWVPLDNPRGFLDAVRGFLTQDA